MPEIVTIEVPCQLIYRDVAGGALRKVCALAKNGEEQTTFEHQVISAYNEAFNNIAEHSCVGGVGDRGVKVIIQKKLAELEILILSFGAGFEMSEADKPDLGDLPESGMGLIIIDSFMDEVEFTKGKGNEPNTVRMKKFVQ